jgi:predicted solute-binding protein
MLDCIKQLDLITTQAQQYFSVIKYFLKKKKKKEGVYRTKICMFFILKENQATTEWSEAFIL